MNLSIILLDILFIIVTGYAVSDLFLFDKSYDFLKKISLSYALGFGLIAIQMFLFYLLHIKWNLLSIFLPWIIFILFYVIKKQKTKIRLDSSSYLKTIRNFSNLEKLLIILIFSLILFVGIESIIRPIQAWDGWDNWVLRSNVFYTKNNIDPYYFKYTTDDYPLLIPLTTTLGYMSIGRIDDTAILLFYYMFYLSLAMLFYSESKKFLGQKLGIIFTFLLLSSQNLIRHGGRFEVGQADLAVGFYIFCSSMLLFDYLKLKSRKSIFFLGLMLGITSQIKNDTLPFVLLSFLIVVFMTIKNKLYKNLYFLLPLPLIILSWNLFKSLNHLHTNFLLRGGIHIHLDRFVIILFQMCKEFLNFKNWNLIWIFFIVCLIFFAKNYRRNWLFMLIFFTQWMAYFMIFTITPVDPVIHINNVIDKLYLHLAPIALLISGLLSQDYLKSFNFLSTSRK